MEAAYRGHVGVLAAIIVYICKDNVLNLELLKNSIQLD